MVIRIITDQTYGHLENGIVKPKTKKSEPFQVDEAKGKRLIDSGIAKEVAPAPEAPETPAPDTHLDEGQLSEMSINELRALAKDMGLSASGSKSDIVARIVAEPVDIDDEGAVDEEDIEDETGADEEPPVLEPAEPEV